MWFIIVCAILKFTTMKFHDEDIFVHGDIKCSDGITREEAIEIIEEIQEFATNDLWQQPYDDTPSPVAEPPTSHSDIVSPTIADVKSSFRKTNPNRSSPPWAPPLKLWVILEDQSAPKFKQLWTQMGREDCFVKD